MEKVRTLTLDGYEYQVSNLRGIIDPGKFYGLALHAVRDHDTSLADEFFGDCSTWGSYYWKVGHRFYCENDQGFVFEVDRDDYESAERLYSGYCDRAERIDTLYAEMRDIEREALPAIDPQAAKQYVFDYAGYYVVTRANTLSDAITQLEATRFGQQPYNASWTHHGSTETLEDSVPYEVVELEPSHFEEWKRSRIEAIEKKIERIEEE